jgi:glycosyltransferase involved in cell wall biosynthesis
MILYRHLSESPGLQLHIYGMEPTEVGMHALPRRLLRRLSRTRLHRFVHDFWTLRDGRWLDKYLPKETIYDNPTIVLTVAHGEAAGAARRFAQRCGFPLISIFHDWWPDMALIHPLLKNTLESRFRRLYQDSQIAFCVSEGMRNQLGYHPNAKILYPIPAKTKATPLLAKTRLDSFCILYSGNLYEYGPMLGKALDELKNHLQIRLEVRGSSPQWPADFCKEMKQRRLWLDFAPRNELELWLASANAFLIPMDFTPLMRRRMETSFPSKLTEFAQFGKPLVIWGPEYCSAVQWARQGDRAMCVTDQSPAALRATLEKLAASPAEQQRLSQKSTEAAQTEFNPDTLQAQFLHAIEDAIKSNGMNCHEKV